MGSLFELLVGIALLVILSCITLFGWQELCHRDRADMIVDNLAASLRFARTQAILRAETIVVCSSRDHQRCGGEWRDGQLVMTLQGTVLQSLEALPPGASLLWRSSFERNQALKFLPSGYTSGQQGRFYYHFPGQTAARVLVVNQTGRVRREVSG